MVLASETNSRPSPRPSPRSSTTGSQSESTSLWNRPNKNQTLIDMTFSSTPDTTLASVPVPMPTPAPIPAQAHTQTPNPTPAPASTGRFSRMGSISSIFRSLRHATAQATQATNTQSRGGNPLCIQSLTEETHN
ncbi:putative uncharacterized protein DDB_G0290521 [Lampris incognitus]|uniref:putative uncharacterized protein DDB_G0290521 n=1 Tax=Lampris incognitus TaxID=2546036 RepID=UPI0024B5AD6A|nr:putative uncharacterized protein DDB_G0290521 [Lampris incognitus]XP_056157664.1 putative uncharacterized protein DDB_G0290521 [Lampris incognitus]